MISEALSAFQHLFHHALPQACLQQCRFYASVLVPSLIMLVVLTLPSIASPKSNIRAVTGVWHDTIYRLRTLFRYFGAKYFVDHRNMCRRYHDRVADPRRELMRRVSNRNQDAEDFNVLNMVLLNIPTVIEMTIPITLIIGSTICFGNMELSNEFVISRGFGRSIRSVLSPPPLSRSCRPCSGHHH